MPSIPFIYWHRRCNNELRKLLRISYAKKKETELDVKLWMINNQFSRRNLSTETRLALAYRFKEFEAEKAKERKLAGVKIESTIEQDTLAHQCAKVDSEIKNSTEEPLKGKTLEVIAQKAGVSTRTAEQYDAINHFHLSDESLTIATRSRLSS